MDWRLPADQVTIAEAHSRGPAIAFQLGAVELTDQPELGSGDFPMSKAVN